MRLFVTKPSPYARKAWSAITELGLEENVAVTVLPARPPTAEKPDLDALNPLGKVPALITQSGELIADSPVIVAYLDAFAGGGLIPRGEERWRALTLEALADGCMDAGVVLRLAALKPEAQRDPAEAAAHLAKIERTLDLIEAEPKWLEGRFNVGQLALVCAVEWLMFREILADPLAGRPRLAEWHRCASDRPALLGTRPAN